MRQNIFGAASAEVTEITVAILAPVPVLRRYFHKPAMSCKPLTIIGYFRAEPCSFS
jgi:hypothetical protein